MNRGSNRAPPLPALRAFAYGLRMQEKKAGLHPRSRHTDRYDFEQLTLSFPELVPFVAINRYNDASIDFADPEAVKTLNRAILKFFYGIAEWELPAEYLCPPIPGRADYLHYAADLLGSCNGGVIPRGSSVQVLDIGVGASCIYPIIGHREYDWRFLGSDVDPVALASAKRIIETNPGLRSGVELRLQSSPFAVFQGLLRPTEVFDLTVCNPPFHASLEEAQAGSRRKWKNLGREPGLKKGKERAPVLNFGGKSTELWCPGGEVAFVRQMIEESAELPTRFFWHSTLISKDSNLPAVYDALERAEIFDCRTIEMSQGQKKSRIVAWTFLNARQQQEWRAKRWKSSS